MFEPVDDVCSSLPSHISADPAGELPEWLPLNPAGQVSPRAGVMFTTRWLFVKYIIIEMRF